MEPANGDNLIPLTTVGTGRRVRVIRVGGGEALRGRLCAMGLTPGTPVAVTCNTGGPLVLDVLGSRLMVGRGMADRILVRPA